MTSCVIHPGEHEAVEGWLCCAKAWGRLAGALRQIPGLCDELAGLGYVQRDTGRRRADDGQVVDGWDPVANTFPAGPLNGVRNGAKVSGSPGRAVPIRIDPTDLTARPRHGSVPVADRSPWPEDQVGYLSAATTLDFWARDWALIRGESAPWLDGERSAGILCRWLLDRLDWACVEYLALDEFAEDVRALCSALYGLNGYGVSRPKLMEAPCPSCQLLTLTQSYPDASIECGTTDCERILTPEEYAEWVRNLIAPPSAL